MSNYRFNNEIDPETEKPRHLHEFYKDDTWVPLTGTSTVCKVISKPLTWWAAGLACAEFGWVKKLDYRKRASDDEKLAHEKQAREKAEIALAELRSLTLEQFMKKLEKAYRAHADSLDKSADAGTDLHAELEDFVKGRMGKVAVREYDPKIQPFIEWADKNVKRFLWSEANCYSERLWTGGISDAGAELNDGSYAIIDFKSSKEAFKSQFIQCAGYAIQIEENGICDTTGQHCKKLDKGIDQLIIVPFGSARPSPVVMRGVSEFKKAFEAAVVLYRLLENYEE